jgi:hypothetical protein
MTVKEMEPSSLVAALLLKLVRNAPSPIASVVILGQTRETLVAVGDAELNLRKAAQGSGHVDIGCAQPPRFGG